MNIKFELRSDERPIVGLAGYAVSSSGVVRNLRTGRILPVEINGQGNAIVTPQGKRRKVCTLVAEAWLGFEPHLGWVLDHRDCNRQNNHVDNLMYIPPDQYQQRRQWANSPCSGAKQAA